jgi:hypothetical protein
LKFGFGLSSQRSFENLIESVLSQLPLFVSKNTSTKNEMNNKREYVYYGSCVIFSNIISNHEVLQTKLTRQLLTGKNITRLFIDFAIRFEINSVRCHLKWRLKKIKKTIN